MTASVSSHETFITLIYFCYHLQSVCHWCQLWLLCYLESCREFWKKPEHAGCKFVGLVQGGGGQQCKGLLSVVAHTFKCNTVSLSLTVVAMPWGGHQHQTGHHYKAHAATSSPESAKYSNITFQFSDLSEDSVLKCLERGQTPGVLTYTVIMQSLLLCRGVFSLCT